MINQRHTMMVNMLEAEYPEIANQLNTRINNSLPVDRISDLTHISKIISAFKKITSLDAKPGKSYYHSITEPRLKLIAVLLLFYHPERLLGIVNHYTLIGLNKKLCYELNCRRQTVSRGFSSAVNSFKIYKGFKADVYKLYDSINEECKLFESRYGQSITE